MTLVSAERWVTPGTRLCAVDEDKYESGTGTYVLGGFLHASLAGRVSLKPVENQEEASSSSQKGLLRVEVRTCKNAQEGVVPTQGDIVTAKVLSVNPRFAKLHILCVRDRALREPFRCQLRKEDVRATEKDKVEMYKSFRPGDIILARVLSLGEASSGYLVTTAENELGVVIAYSEASYAKMIPVSWTEMQCPETYTKESRKIAKVCPENLVDLAKMEACET